MDTRQKRRPAQARRQPSRQQAPSRPRRRPATASGSRPAPARSNRQPRQRPEREEVVYTQPPAFNRAGFVMHMLTVFAVVLALALGMSIFFKVENVMVAGAEKYSAWDVREASGIQDGENLLTLSKASIGGRIRTALPYVKSVRIGIKLPDTVNIEIEELDVVYAINDVDDGWWLINAEGKVVDMTDFPGSRNYTRIVGVKLQNPIISEYAVAAQVQEEETLEPTQPEDETNDETTDETADETTEPTEPMIVPVTVPASEQLRVAVNILQHLEENSIIGKVTTLDVTNISDLSLWYEDRYQVFLGDTSELGLKIRSMKEAVAQMTGYQNGELDISFTTWPDKVGYTPFQDGES